MLEVHSLAQDEQQPERPQGGRISRDTLLLIGALTFFYHRRCADVCLHAEFWPWRDA